MAYTRDRSISVLSPLKIAMQYYGSSTNYAQRRTLSRTRTGDRNRYYKQQIRDQQNATTPMTGTFEELDSVPGTAVTNFTRPVAPFDQLTNRADGYLANGHLRAWWAPTITSEVADNRAMQAYLKDIHGKQTLFEGYVFLGELKETLRMLRNPAKGLFDLLGAYGRDVKHRKKTLGDRRWRKSLSGLWLEYSFGISPLLNDIKGAYGAYEALRNRDRQLPVKGFGKQTISVPNYSAYVLVQHTAPKTAAYSLRIRSTEDAIVLYRGMVRQSSTGSLWENKNLFGFQTAQFLPSAYELLPWSFLFDYFLNLGAVIQSAVTATHNVAWTNRTSINMQSQEIATWHNEKATKQSYPTYVSSYGDSSTCRLRKRTVNRSPNHIGFYVPSLEFSFPGRNAQWLNMGALWAQFSSIHPQRLR